MACHARSRHCGIEAACATLRDALGPLTNLYSPAAYKRELARILLRKAVLELREMAA